MTWALPFVAAAVTWAALTAWRDFLDTPSHYLDPLAVVAVVIATSGVLLRWRGVPAPLTVLVQTVLAAGLVSHQVTGSPVFLAGAGAELWRSLDIAVNSAQTYAAPISDGAPPVWPLLLVAGAFFVLVVDVVACTARRVPGAGLALLAVYAVPGGLLEQGPDALTFAVAALGFLLMLHLESREQLRGWGRAVGPDDAERRARTHPVLEAARAGAGRIGVSAIVLALAVPAVVPGLDLDLLELGARGGDTDIRIRKPVADMRRDLQRDVDIPLLTVQTDDPSPAYLRISVLNRFTGQEWSSGDRDVARENDAAGELPAPAGMAASVPRRSYVYQVRVSEDFDSTWLPTQFPAAAVTADGDWRFDPATMDFLAADEGVDTRGLEYRMIGLEPRYGTDGRYFRDAPTGAVPEEMLELPDSLPGLVDSLASSVTAEAVNDYERALLLQRWFRRDGGFVYDLRRGPEGTGNNTLEAFLAEDGRVGYCEQYASAMAVMARALGIPARVAVGFLQPDRIDDSTWEYSSHDLHAWPELYFAGSGWVRFEPTPAARVESVPAYSRVTVGADDDIDEGSPSTAPEPSEGAPSAAPSAAPRAAPQDSGDTEDAGDTNGVDAQTWLVLLAAGVAVALAAAGAIGPRTLRRRQRESRLAGDAEEIWAELRATALDTALPWPEGRSPGDVEAVLVTRLAPSDEAAHAALSRLVAAVEQHRYARPGTLATLERTDLAQDAVTVLDALGAGVTPRVRRRATWAPRSVWSGWARR